MRAIGVSTQKGLSLIELMVAMLLALILIGGVVQIFISSRVTYSTTSALSEVQEGGRFGSEFLSFDIRNSSYKGECGSGTIDNLTGFGTDVRFDLDKGLQGWDSSQATLPTWFDPTNRLAGTDMVLLLHAVNTAGVTVDPSNVTDRTGTTITLTEPSEIASGTVIVVSNTMNCEMFINQSDSTLAELSRPAGVESKHDYAGDTAVYKFQSAIYYIKAGAAGEVPSLYRIRFNNGSAGSDPELLVEGVQNMQIQYALGNAQHVITGNYLNANELAETDWANVASVRFSLLVVSREKNVVPENQVISFNGSDVTIEDRRLARVFTSTIGIRNRLQ